MAEPAEVPSAITVLAALGDWAGGPGPRYRRLAVALRRAIEQGTLAAGTRLPPERALAAMLGVARGTVVAAFDDLAATGLLDRRQGSGTRVAQGVASAIPRQLPSAAGLRAQRLTGRLFHADEAVIDLGISLLPDTAGLPADAFAVDAGLLAVLADGHGYHPLGLPALREAIAALHRAEGLPTTAAQIAVTNGGQHAIALAARVLVEPGGAVAVESPTYPGAIDAFARAGARFVTVASDGAGVRPDAAARTLATHDPAVLYLVPTAQNPTGTVLPPVRRRELARLAGERGTWLVEDESLRWTVFERSRPPAPIATHPGGAERVVTVGSFSKLLWGGLRVGWLRGPAPLVERIGRLRAADDLGSSALSQAVVLGLLDRVDEIAARRRAALAAGSAQLMAGLAEHLPDWTFRPPDGGLSLWVRLPEGTGDAFASTALAHGVGVLPGSAACVDEAHLDHIRLSFALPPSRLDLAVDRLASAWRSRAASRPPAPTTTPLG